jgi:hypothetical protein
MIPMPTDEVVFVSVRLLFDAIIEDENAVGAFDLMKHRFGYPPQISAGLGRRSQKSDDLIVRDFAVY